MAPWWITERWQLASVQAARIIRLVAELRFYLGGDNYISGRYKGTHTMLFVLEENLRALDLDGDVVLRDDHSFPVAELLYDIVRAAGRVEELVEDMKRVVDEAGAGGGNGGAAAAAQAAVARWLADDENLMRMKIQTGQLASLCQRGKPILDSERYSEAELEQLRREPVVPEKEVDHVDGSGSTLAKFLKKIKKWKLRRLLRR